MEYRRLGRTGLRLSALSFGTWLTFTGQASPQTLRECLVLARDAGVNYFDSAESYGAGAAERELGAALDELRWDRRTYVLSTKLYWGLLDAPNMRRTLNRKYLLESIGGCLERLRTPYVDLLLCHRHDPDT